MVAGYAYAPYGETYNTYGAITNELSFTGDTQDLVAGTYDTPNRELNPSEGRWISPDPAGIGAVNFSNSQTFNRYSYVANYPLTVTDPTGMDMNGSGYDGWDPVPSHAGSGSLMDAFVAAVSAVREGKPLPLPGERFDSDEFSPFEYSVDGVAFSTWTAAAAFAQAQNNATGQTQAPVVRFEGNQGQRKELKTAWHHLITHSAHAKALLNKDLKEKGDLKIRPTNHDAYYDSHDNSINVDPNVRLNVYTSNGVQPASTEIILGHELGHGGSGKHDDGPNNMNNVNATENPIRHDLGLPDRTKYELAPDNPQ